MLAYAVDFVYHQGILCYRMGHEIRVLNVHRGAHQEQVLNLYEILPRLGMGPLDMLDPASMVELIHYSNGILIFRLHGFGLGSEDTLVAIDMARRPSHRKRLLLQERIPSLAPIFVRHSRSYLWYGIFVEGLGSSGVWSCSGVDLATEEKIPFHLDQVVDGELGQSICFDIYQEHLYVISTQVTSEEDERFSSFYHWFCYAPRQKGRKWSGKSWRREHREGPINEMWTDLSIRKDETTGRPMIVECRREWPDGKSEHHRTTYTEPLSTPLELQVNNPEGDIRSPVRSDDSDSDEGPSTSKDPMIARTYDHRPEKRLRRNYHPEHELSDDPSARQEFIYAHTKHHSYELASSTFVDLVNDPTPQADGVRARDRLRLRTVSRKRKCPMDEEATAGEAGLLFRPTQVDTDGHPVEGSEERFVSRGVHMWPSEDAPAELHNLLCPDQRSGVVKAIADERSLIYSISCPGLPSHHRALILISFDPKLHLPTMKPLSSLEGFLGSVSPVALPKPRASSGGSIKDSDPLYKAINRGYWLR